MDLTIFTPNFGVSSNLISTKLYPVNQPNNYQVYPAWNYEYGSVFPTKGKKLDSDDYRIIFEY